MKKTKLFNFAITPELNDWLAEIAWRNRMSKAAYLTMLIEKDRKEKEESEER